jgi:type IV fimbrial biogenesis protein FimT
MRGFTLIELMVTLVVAGILLALAAPRFSNLVQGDRLTGQANKLVLDLSVARSEAIKRGTSVTVCKQDPAQSGPSCNTTGSDTWTGGWVTFVDDDGDGQISAGESVLHVREPLEGAKNTMTASAGADTSAVFAASGLAGSKAAFLFCDGRGIGNALAVQLLATGRASAVKPATLSISSCSATSGWAY